MAAWILWRATELAAWTLWLTTVQTNTMTSWTATGAWLTLWRATEMAAWILWRATELAAWTLWLTTVQTLFQTTWTAIKVAVMEQTELMRQGVVLIVTQLHDQLNAIFDDLKTDAYNAGQAIGNNIAQGIRDSIPAAVAAAQALADAVNAVLPHSDAKEGPLSHLTDSGRAVPVTLARGMASGESLLAAASRRLAETMDVTANMRPAAIPLGAGEGGPTTNNRSVHVTINNPRGEPSETSLVRQLRNLQYVGVLE
jgi:hypothetical protein